MKIRATDAFIGVDLQNDFVSSSGEIPVPHGEAVIGVVNYCLAAFPITILTQDWHPRGHVSFASSHDGGAVGMQLGDQLLWPDHCIQGTWGALLSSDVEEDRAQLILRKGFRRGLDSYSAFVEQDRMTTTGLAGYLRERGVARVFVAGLATDFCVGETALGAAAAGFTTYLVADGCQEVNFNGSGPAMGKRLFAAGIRTVISDDLEPFSAQI